MTFILDPTINWVAQEVNEIAENSYVPYYASPAAEGIGRLAATVIVRASVIQTFLLPSDCA